MFNNTNSYGEYHAGRSFAPSTRIEDECPCPKTDCGLVATSDWDMSTTQSNEHGCSQHVGLKTVRQSHHQLACPALKNAWSTDDGTLIVAGTHDYEEAIGILNEYLSKELGESGDNLTATHKARVLGFIDDNENLEDLVRLSAKVWANRNDPTYLLESWEEGFLSKEPKTEQDTPLLILPSC